MTEAAGEIPLAAEDRAILALECSTVVGHTCKVVVLGGDPVDAGALRERIASRIGAAPELRYRLGGTTERPVWVPAADLDLEAHIVDCPGPAVDPTGLGAAVAEVFGRHLDRARPLWAMDVVALAGGGTAILWRLHHALADGTTGLRLARAVLLDPVTTGAGATPTAPPTEVLRRDHARRRAHLAAFLAREFTPGVCRSPFDGTIGTRREVAFVDTPFAPLHAAARACGATVNDALLAVTAGSVRRWLEHHGARVSDLRIRVPVSLHERLPSSVRRWLASVQAGPREFAVALSNVIGPREPVTVLGRPVTSICPVVEVGRRHALRISVMSGGGRLGFALCADPGIVPDVGRLASGLEDEVALLAS